MIRLTKRQCVCAALLALGCASASLADWIASIDKSRPWFNNVRMPIRIVHLLAADMPASKLPVLSALLSKLNERHRHTVVQVGAGDCAKLPGHAARHRIRAAFDIPWLAAGRVDRFVRQCGADVGHIWSSAALSWCAALIGKRPLLIESESPRDSARIARWTAPTTGAARGLACPTALTMRRMVEHGVDAKHCAVIRDYVDFSAINKSRSADVRGALRLDDSHRVVLLLPPVTRRGGHTTAMWATLLVHVVRDDVRLLIPGRSREALRLKRLAGSVGRMAVTRFPGDRYELPELLAASDVALYLPPEDAPVGALVWAMASGRPILASATYAVAEMLADQHNAWLCRPDDPKAAAKKLLRVIESPADSRELIDRARSQAYEIFGRQRMVTQYARAYDNLIAGVPVGEGIVDSAVKG